MLTDVCVTDFLHYDSDFIIPPTKLRLRLLLGVLVGGIVDDMSVQFSLHPPADLSKFG